jgi:hypothetical protein
MNSTDAYDGGGTFFADIVSRNPCFCAWLERVWFQHVCARMDLSRERLDRMCAVKLSMMLPIRTQLTLNTIMHPNTTPHAPHTETPHTETTHHTSHTTGRTNQL